MPMRLSGLATGMDTEALVGQLMSAQSLKKKKMTGAKTKLEWKKEAWSDLNKKLTTLYNGSVSKLRLPSTYNVKKATLSDNTKASITADTSAVVGNYTMEVKQIASAQFLTSGKTSIGSTSQVLAKIGTEGDELNDMVGKKITFTNGSKSATLEIGESTDVNAFLKTARSVGINANYDTTQKKFFFSSAETGEANAFSITDSDADGNALNGTALSYLGLKSVEAGKDSDGNVSYKVNGKTIDQETYTDPDTKMALVAAKDSKIILNGAELTSSSSTVRANGLNISLTSKTLENQPVTFSVSNDIDAVYDSVKKALKEYNDVMKEMQKLYSADSSKGYEPLTSEEKRAMSDDEVEEWEKKIKDSLLRRDSTLAGITSSMRSALMTSTTVNGNSYTLSSFGIMTSTNYREGGLLHIYGDPDDDVYSAENDKLKKALTENPEEAVTALTNIFENLRKTMFDKMRGTEYSNALTFYNDKQMDKELESYKKDLKAWDDKMADIETAYYKKFAAMETAMAKLQQQSSSVMGLFGMS